MSSLIDEGSRPRDTHTESSRAPLTPFFHGGRVTRADGDGSSSGATGLARVFAATSVSDAQPRGAANRDPRSSGVRIAMPRRKPVRRVHEPGQCSRADVLSPTSAAAPTQRRRMGPARRWAGLRVGSARQRHGPSPRKSHHRPPVPPAGPYPGAGKGGGGRGKASCPGLTGSRRPGGLMGRPGQEALPRPPVLFCHQRFSSDHLSETRRP
jgi:hypothetical protein